MSNANARRTRKITFQAKHFRDVASHRYITAFFVSIRMPINCRHWFERVILLFVANWKFVTALFAPTAVRDIISTQISDLFRRWRCIAKLTRLPSQLPLSNERLTIRNDLQLVRLSSSSLVSAETSSAGRCTSVGKSHSRISHCWVLKCLNC